jgi:hypothetical protein
MAVRKLAATLFASGALVAGSLLGLTGPASASAQPDNAQAMKALAGAQHRAVESPAETRSAGAAQLACAYKYVCGEASNGHSFAYTKCSTLYQLPDLVGSGSLINNQTTGTVAYFYDKNQNFLFSSTAYDSRTVNWTPVWYAIAC